MAACLRALQKSHGVELLIYHSQPDHSAPFDGALFTDLSRLVPHETLSPAEMLRQTQAFSPQAVFMSGWTNSDYLKVARDLRRNDIPVVAGCDRQWTGSIKQRVGQLTARWYLHTAIDVLWVPGERQRQLAARLGFRGAKCWTGLYCCDWDSFARVKEPVSKRPRAFLFVGRYIEKKGVSLLLESYRRYRNRTNDPWPLICVGTGPEACRMAQVGGVKDFGFVQPKELPALMGLASAFVLPSVHEPWGVVIQEAAAAGLPLICSDACGATVHLLHDNINGFLVQSGSVEQLTKAMTKLSGLNAERLAEMGQHSYKLSKQFTPEYWSETFFDGVQAMMSSRS